MTSVIVRAHRGGDDGPNSLLSNAFADTQPSSSNAFVSVGDQIDVDEQVNSLGWHMGVCMVKN